LIAGEFETNKPWISFDYEVKADIPVNLTRAAHVSWLSRESGLLMLNDLLPQLKRNQAVAAKVTLEIPAGWKISTNETPSNEKNAFGVENIEKAVFFIAKNRRETIVSVDKTNLNLAIAGNNWQFTDDEASAMAGAILEEYRKIFGSIPDARAQILLLPFPRETSQTDRWRAETRGNTIIIVSGAIPLKSQALQRLHEQLRHEIFHLWIPNALNLSGNYDWFYEGFTVYQALRTGVELNQIRFEDFLNTLSRAYDLAQNQKTSLTEISNKRWLNPGSSVYGKGMIVAFLCDAAIMRESNGKRTLSNVFREIYQKHRFPNSAHEANGAILNIFKSRPELKGYASNYIEGTAKIDWQNELDSFGIEAGKNEFGTVLKVSGKLSGRQKDLLDKLGYNQWRKLLQKSNDEGFSY
jgi:predicted metalloprotease with PDZ domain